jgi:hypothetical protein
MIKDLQTQPPCLCQGRNYLESNSNDSHIEIREDPLAKEEERA